MVFSEDVCRFLCLPSPLIGVGSQFSNQTILGISGIYTLNTQSHTLNISEIHTSSLVCWNESL